MCCLLLFFSLFQWLEFKWHLTRWFIPSQGGLEIIFLDFNDQKPSGHLEQNQKWFFCTTDFVNSCKLLWHFSCFTTVKREPRAEIINYSCILQQNYASVCACLQAHVHKFSSSVASRPPAYRPCLGVRAVCALAKKCGWSVPECVQWLKLGSAAREWESVCIISAVMVVVVRGAGGGGWRERRRRGSDTERQTPASVWSWAWGGTVADRERRDWGTREKGWGENLGIEKLKYRWIMEDRRKLCWQWRSWKSGKRQQRKEERLH